MLDWIWFILSIPTLTWLILYTVPLIYINLIRPVPNLKKRYDNAEWALVTGGGSGIGKSLVFKLASQGLNVIIVSLDDDKLKQTLQEVKAKYPDLKFRSVGIAFSPDVDYMTPIREATKDIEVPIIFNNAGYIVTGFLDQTDIKKQLANLECNATACVNITHHFCQLMVQRKQRGCIVFTSSAAAMLPAAFAILYASTKAFISQFAACLHVEVAALGIDVVAIHPSPVETSFYDKVDHKIEMMEQAQSGAVSPDTLPNQMFRAIGACAHVDVGGLAIGARMGTFFLPYNAFTQLFAMAAPYLPDYKKHNATRFQTTTTTTTSKKTE